MNNPIPTPEYEQDEDQQEHFDRIARYMMRTMYREECTCSDGSELGLAMMNIYENVEPYLWKEGLRAVAEEFHLDQSVLLEF